MPLMTFYLHTLILQLFLGSRSGTSSPSTTNKYILFPYVGLWDKENNIIKVYYRNFHTALFHHQMLYI